MLLVFTFSFHISLRLLSTEYRKRNQPLSFNIVKYDRLPKQSNSVDCGLFLVSYAKALAQVHDSVICMLEEKLVEKRIYLIICFDSIACLILINQLSPIFFLQKGTGWLTNGACDIVSREYLRQILKV